MPYHVMTGKNFKVRCFRINFSGMNPAGNWVFLRILTACCWSFKYVFIIVIVMLFINRQRVLKLHICFVAFFLLPSLMFSMFLLLYLLWRSLFYFLWLRKAQWFTELFRLYELFLLWILKLWERLNVLGQHWS